MLRPFTPTRCLALLACVSCLLLFTLVPRYDLLSEPQSHVAARALPGLPTGDGNTGNTGASSGGVTSPTGTSDTGTPTTSPATSAPATSPATSPPDKPTSDTSATTSPPNTSGTDTGTTSLPSPTSDPNSTSSGNNDSSSSSPPPQQSQASTPPPSENTKPTPTVLSSVSTDSNGELVTVFITTTPSVSATSHSSSTSAGADQSNDDDSHGVSTSTIVGLSVAGGIAFVGIVAFVIWKFTRKRDGDDFDDNEAIKWPELNAHGDNPLALPTRAGAAGFETNSEVNLARPDSRAGSIAPSAATSAADLFAPNAAQDPYAVPPLPHLNPNQPYRDDPSGTFYDPYNGPVPQSFAEPPGGEAIPMTQINRARSPGPMAAYEAGRMSPGPQAAYYPDGGRNSPAPRAMSPGPAMALSGRASPGPGPALSGRASPGPGPAYGYAG